MAVPPHSDATMTRGAPGSPSSLAAWVNALADAPEASVARILDEGLTELGATVTRQGGAISIEGPDSAHAALQMGRAVLRARGLDDDGRPRGPDPHVHRAALGALMSGLSHELNNPLAAVIANLDLAARQVDDQLRTTSTYTWLDDLHAELEDARAAADQLHRLVRRVRPLGARANPREEAHLVPILQASLALLGRALRRRGRLRHGPPPTEPVRLRPSPHLTMHAVLGQLFHALHTLPSTPNQREIGLDIQLQPNHTVQLRVSARPGLPHPDATPSTATQRLARALAADAGGTFVEAPSDPEEWSCTLELPRRREATPALPPRRQRDRVGRVLVIDDEPLIGKLVSRVLSGHDVVVVHDGATGLARARREAWDLVLLDVHLSDLSGDAVASELAALDPTTAGAVVRMSGGPIEAGPGERPVLRKPFEPQALRDLLKSRLTRG